MSVGLEHYLVLSAVLFCIGLYGVLTKRNAVIILMCIELMLNAVNISMVAFSGYIVPLMLTGQVFSIFVMVVALFFGTVVKKTGSLLGVSLAHGITNSVLYLVAPFFF